MKLEESYSCLFSLLVCRIYYIPGKSSSSKYFLSDRQPCELYNTNNKDNNNGD